MTAIKPIQTIYSGYKFRSRLEARWAVFFNELGLNWEYEVEGYDLGSVGWYLPDFLITTPTGLKYIYEVKPRESSEGKEKLNTLINFSKEFYGGNILYGDPFDVIIGNMLNNKMVICPRCGAILLNDVNYRNIDCIYCEPCDIDTPTGSGNPEECSLMFEGIKFYPHKGDICLYDESLEKFNIFVMNAAYKARSARFEHGESGAT